MSGNTTNKFLAQPANGADVGTWDIPVNANSATIDTAFGGLTNLNATSQSGNVTLALTQYVPPDIIITGTPAGNLSYQLPGNIGGFWSVLNSTSGNATVGISSASGGNSTTLPQGYRTAVISDGNGNVTRFDGAPGNAGGNTTQVQYNSGGVLVGSPNWTFNGSVANLTGTFQFAGASSGYVGFVASATSTPTIWTLPSGDGAPGQVWTTSGASILSWTTPISTSTVTTFTAGVQTTPVAPVFSATAMVVDCTKSNVFRTTFTANVTTAPTFNLPGDGQTINWRITQDGTGSRTMTWPTSFKWPGGVKGVLSTAANAVDLLVATYFADTGFWEANLLKAFS